MMTEEQIVVADAKDLHLLHQEFYMLVRVLICYSLVSVQMVQVL